jgi:tetratricopeptide (TPR) repeat protein
MNGMAAMFYLLAFLLYVRARLATGKRWKWALFAGCLLAGIMALGSKEIAATLPFFIFLYEWYFFQDLSWPWLKRHLFLFGGILALFATVALLFFGADPVERILESYNTRDFTLTQRILTQFRVVVFYISLLLFPHPSRLNLDHHFPISHSLLDPLTTVLSIGALIGLTALACFMAKKQRLLSFCILWFFGNLVIESSVIGLELVFEHRNYLPSVLVTIMVASLAYRHIKPKWLGGALLCALVMVFSIWAHERSAVWSDDVKLWSDCVVKSPKKARPHSNLGASLALRGRIQEAINHYMKALKINPNYDEAQYNMGVALDRRGKSDEAAAHYSKVLQINPDHAEAHYNMGVILSRQKMIDEAIAHLAEALRIKPNFVKAHVNMGSALLSQGKTEEAVAHFANAVRIEPNHSEAHYNMGVALESKGKRNEAIAHYSKALEINPEDALAHYNMGVNLANQGKIDKAIMHFAEAVRIKPKYVQAHHNMGSALLMKGGVREAIEHYSKALEINPGFAEAHYNLGGAYLRLGDRDSAEREYEILKRLDGELAKALLERIHKR